MITNFDDWMGGAAKKRPACALELTPTQSRNKRLKDKNMAAVIDDDGKKAECDNGDHTPCSLLHGTEAEPLCEKSDTNGTYFCVGLGNPQRETA